MNLSGLFILANGVEFIPVDSFVEKTKSGFEHHEDDVVITQLNARTTSKVINKDLAAILQEFRTPKSLADVILSFSQSKQKDPQQVADEVFSSFVRILEWGFIITFKGTDDPAKKPALQVNEEFRGYTIIENLQF